LAKKLQELIAKYEVQGLIEACHHSFVPVAQIKSIDEVFEADAAQNLVLEENIEGMLTRRVKTAVFKALD
jgi:crotonobetainyl-CoA:carnitine CoA-transferase CaiB-like acyl-CoA transferase